MTSYRSLALKRYHLRTGIAVAAYVVTLTAAVRLVGDGSVTGPAAYVLALLPGLSVLGIFWAIARLMMEEKDEYQRMLLVRQSLIATAFTLAIVTMWGFLENFDLVPHVDAFYIAPLWSVGAALGSCVNWVMQRGDGERA